ncbi:MAG: AAA family ATPase [Butyricicoccus pullicaecorum]|nr:AAA family ATPase [Butyricicoccus pullicaecorum]MDO4668368.1 AAA family ATPase [Butyricicoccus pullicaecorum]
MNIKQAKQEIIHTIRAYLARDRFGAYQIPSVRQRPILLMGPPGIGKTQIMEQIAAETEIGLVAYTITHHTRQSALGLPYIEHHTYDGQDYAVTSYTMSEILASVYQLMERTGVREGILFLDEINCISETLTPMMLQFLQCKTFGNQKLPEGWIIVAAGNPPEYNKSVREFDVVTLDRVRRIDVQEDFTVWKEYAYRRGLHGAVISYLDIRKENFYQIEAAADGMQFATARGWEDLAALLTVYESLELPVDRELIGQYIQLPRIAKDFANYLELYRKYQRAYRIDEILDGRWDTVLASELKAAPFDETLSVLGLLLSRLAERARIAWQQDGLTDALYTDLTRVKGSMTTATVSQALTAILTERSQALAAGREAGTLDLESVRRIQQEISIIEQYLHAVQPEHTPENAFACVKEQFAQQADRRAQAVTEAGQGLDHAFRFLEEAVGEGQEMVMFATELTANFYTAWYIQNCGCEAYYRHNQAILFDDTQSRILDEIAQMKS